MSTTSASRGRYAKTGARRREIQQAALEVFSASGYNNGSIRDIADRVGISQAGVLFHFKTKVDLLSAVLELRDDHSKDRFAASSDPGIDQLRAVVNLVRDNVQEPLIIELYSVLSAESTRREHPAHVYFRDRYQWIIAHAQKSFLALREQGLLRSGVEPGHAARTLVATIDGLQLQWLYDNDSVDMVADIRTYLQSLITVPL